MNEIYLYDRQTGKYIKPIPSMRSLEREYGLYRGAVQDILNGHGGIGKKFLVSREKHDFHPLFFSKKDDAPTVISTDEPLSPGEVLLSENELRHKHDMFFKVISFVKGIPDGKYIEETAMLRQLGMIGKPRYKDAITRPELKDYKGKVDGVTYYGTQSSIVKLKQEGVLQ